jgi:hypothetical protein
VNARHPTRWSCVGLALQPRWRNEGAILSQTIAPFSGARSEPIEGPSTCTTGAMVYGKPVLLSRSCPGAVPELSRSCPGAVPELSRSCPGAVPELSRFGEIHIPEKRGYRRSGRAGKVIPNAQIALPGRPAPTGICVTRLPDRRYQKVV